MQLRRLVFPAPFGPTIAWSVPAATERVTSVSADTPRKLRKIPFASRSATFPRRVGDCVADGRKEPVRAQAGAQKILRTPAGRGRRLGDPFGRPQGAGRHLFASR